MQEAGDGVRVRLQGAERELEKALFLRLTGGKRPNASVRHAIAGHERAARKLILEAEALAASDAEAAWIEQALAESVALARARGEAVEDEPAQAGKVRKVVMLSRGSGLKHAKDNGYLAQSKGPDQSEALFRIGVRYGTAYEVAEGLASHRGDQPGGNGFRAGAPQVRVVEAGAFLALARAALTPRQRAVLDAVCGQGLGMYEAARACRIETRPCRTALRTGLAAVMAAETVQAKRAKEDPDSVHRLDLAAANDLIERAARAA